MGTNTMKWFIIFLAFFSMHVVFAEEYPPTTSKSSSDSSNVVTWNYFFPNFTGTHSGPNFTLGVNSVAGGGTGNTSFTAGSVLFSNGSIVTQNNSQLFWDNTNLRLGIGTTTPISALQISNNVAGNVSSNVTNSNTGTQASTSVTVSNNTGNQGSFSIFSSTFVATYLQNVTRLASTNGLWLVSDVNNASGGTDPIQFSVGGYNNVTAQVTTNGMTANNFTDSALVTSNPGAPISVNSSGTLVSGITNIEASSTTATTSSTGGTTLLTITPSYAGTYFVIYSGNITASSAGGNILTMTITVNGTTQAQCTRTINPFSSAGFAVFQNANIATNCIVSYTTGTIAAVGTSSAGTVTTTQRTLDIIRVQ